MIIDKIYFDWPRHPEGIRSDNQPYSGRDPRAGLLNLTGSRTGELKTNLINIKSHKLFCEVLIN
jgi:hypothetical protein